MWDFSLRRSLTLMAQTMSFIVLRCLVYFGIVLAYVLASGIGAGIGWSVGGLGDEGFRMAATLWGGGTGFVLTAGVLFFLRGYILYLVKAGHIAAMVKLLDGAPLPSGRAQLEHAVSEVRHRFLQANMLFAIDQLIKGVVAAVTGLVQSAGTMLPIPGVQQLMGVVRAFLHLAVGLVDEVILAYIIKTDSDNPWASARTGLVLYGQNAPRMMKNAAWLALLSYGVSGLVFLALLAPATALLYALPGAWSAGGVGFALLLAWALKAAVIEPFAIACLLQVYFQAIKGQKPDPEWETRLESVSDKFGQLKDKAVRFSAHPAQAPKAPPARV